MSDYNGWTNYETWLLNLHFDDWFHEEAGEMYNDAEACDTFTKRENASHALAEYIESYVEEVLTPSIKPATHGFVADVVNAALRECNYYEIAKHYVDEVEDE